MLDHQPPEVHDALKTVPIRYSLPAALAVEARAHEMAQELPVAHRRSLMVLTLIHDREELGWYSEFFANSAFEDSTRGGNA